jgi:hypothetical protein
MALPLPGTLDQQQADNTWDPAGFGGVTLGQSFTVGHAGTLTRVEVDVYPYYPNPTTLATLSIYAVDGSGLPTGSALTSAQTTVGNGGFMFNFTTTPSVAVGQKLAMTLSWEAGESFEWRGTCGTGYSAGEALMNEGSGWETFAAYVSDHGLNANPSYCVKDFAFSTYVLAPQTTKLVWDKTQVTAGETTPLTLTETFTFSYNAQPGAVGVPAAPIVGVGLSAKQVALPSWFIVASVACSSQVASGDCTKANVAQGASVPVTTPDGNPVVLTLTGSATPKLTDAGAKGTAEGSGCVTTVVANPVSQCVNDQATVAVVAAAATPTPPPTGTPTPTEVVQGATAAPTTATTPPPTATLGTASGGDSATPLVLLTCLAFGFLSLAIVQVRGRRARG